MERASEVDPFLDLLLACTHDASALDELVEMRPTRMVRRDDPGRYERLNPNLGRPLEYTPSSHAQR